MERYLFCVVPAGLIITGVCMVLCPGAVAARGRDRDDPTLVPGHEIWLMRGLGLLWWRAAPTGSTRSWRACRGLSSTGSEVTGRADAVNAAYPPGAESRDRLHRACSSAGEVGTAGRAWSGFLLAPIPPPGYCYGP